MTIADLINNHFWAIFWIYFSPIAFLGMAIRHCNKRVTAQEKPFVILDIGQAKKFHFLMDFPIQTREFMDNFRQSGFDEMFLTDWHPDFKTDWDPDLKKASRTIRLNIISPKPIKKDGVVYGPVQTIKISRSFWEGFTLESVKKEISLKIKLLEQNMGNDKGEDKK